MSSKQIGFVGTGRFGQAVMMRINMLQFERVGWRLFATKRSAGRQFTLQGRRYIVEELRREDGHKPFDGLTRVLVCAPPDVALHVAHECVYGDRAVRRSVIDCSGAFADWDDVVKVDGSEIQPSLFNQHTGVIAPKMRSFDRAAFDVARVMQHIVMH